MDSHVFHNMDMDIQSSLGDESSTCPILIPQNCSGNRTYYTIGAGPSCVAIASSFFSCLGSILIVIAFIIFKDIRNGMAQRIVTALAIADFVSAAGYIVGSINFLVHRNSNSCPGFTGICRAQAFVTSWSSMSSFAWTAILAVYFHIVLAYKRRRPFHPKYQELALHIFAWASPLLIVIPFTGLQYLGYAPYAASNWCFVKDPYVNKSANDNPIRLLKSSVKVLGAGKFWEILTYFLVIILYTHIICIIDKIRRTNYEPGARAERGKVERKMIFIPLLFLLLRIWGTTEFFLNIAMEVTHPSNNGCILKDFHTANVVLGYFQAIGDPGQGWGNAILYVFLSDTIRKRLITNPLRRCCRGLGYGLLDLTHNSEDPDPRERLTRDNENTPLLNEDMESPSLGHGASRRKGIQRYDTISTISAADLSMPGPLEEARPGPSPVPEADSLTRLPQVLGTLASETTTTTTTAAISVEVIRPGPLPGEEQHNSEAAT